MRTRAILFIVFLSAIRFPLSGFAQTPTPTATPTPHAINLTDTSVYKAGTNLNAVLRAIDDGHGAYVPAFILVDTNGDPASLGGGSVTVAGAQYTIAISSVTASGSVAAGKHHIEFILSTDFAGSIGGVTMNPANLAVYSPGDAPVGSTFAALSYTISAGSAILTTW